MATTTIDTLLIKIDADIASLRSGLSSAEKQLQGFSKNTETKVSAIGAQFSRLGGFIGAYLGVQTARQIVGTIVSFEKLQASLTTVTGSAEEAAKSFGMIKQFATDTPYSVEEITTAFIRLKSLGIEPTQPILESFGNTASAMGDSILRFSETVAKATVGEYESLRTFGIMAKKEGDNVTFYFDGVSTTVANTSEEIVGFLKSIGDVKFAGAMEQQMSTLGGSFSNLGDAFGQLSAAIGESGLSDILVSITAAAINFLTAMESLIKTEESAAVTSHELAMAQAEIAQAENELARIVKGSAKDHDKNRARINQRILAAKLLIIRIEDEAEANAKLNDVKEEAVIITKDLTDTQKKNIESLKDIGKVQQLVDYEKNIGLLKLLDEAYVKTALSAEDYSRAIKFLTEDNKNLTDEMTLVPAVVTAEKRRITQKEFNKEYYEALASVVPRATNELDRFAASATNIQDVLINLSMSGIGAIEDSFVNLINGTNSVKESFKSMANSIINDIIRMTVRQQISAPIAAALGSFIGGMGAAGTSGGSLPYSSSLRDSYSAASNNNYFASAGLTKRASGGNVSAGVPYSVGERGAELFVPNTSGKIISAGNMKSGGNTTVINQSVNISAGVAQTVRAEIYSLLPRIKMETIAAINDIRMRTG